MNRTSAPQPAWPRRAAGFVVGSLCGSVMVVLCVLCGIGLLYGLRGLGVLGVGPKVPDALPLLQLAGFDGQPLGRVLVAWLAAGLVLGLALIRVHPLPRSVAAGGTALVLLLFASQASFALARNLRFTYVLNHRTPELGPWLEALLLAIGCALPRPLEAWRRPAFPGSAHDRSRRRIAARGEAA